MKTLSRKILMITLVTALSAPVALLAAEKTAPANPPHDQMQARMQTMQARMQTMQKTEGEARMPMMAAQMDDMQAMMKDFGAGCPMGGGQGNTGMQGKQGMPMTPGAHGSQGK
ncbi:conserved exported hypothetical protein [Candidatus Accumulibacter aalborgensis]|uniref:Uncharacterized protein n=1 Tax=Candidatus Accumulibacter aalborgensis TaxID=1860102 RepID=A0A1A8XVT6_9PROT|nr:hypothetical protein [Candidatus Accumulibacter aalborgensis]SBT09125.1 conserved exported hypothetical protein [Candidatus Accumulibacter aalborgensis]